MDLPVCIVVDADKGSLGGLPYSQRRLVNASLFYSSSKRRLFDRKAKNSNNDKPKGRVASYL